MSIVIFKCCAHPSPGILGQAVPGVVPVKFLRPISHPAAAVPRTVVVEFLRVGRVFHFCQPAQGIIRIASCPSWLLLLCPVSVAACTLVSSWVNRPMTGL